MDGWVTTLLCGRPQLALHGAAPMPPLPPMPTVHGWHNSPPRRLPQVMRRVLSAARPHRGHSPQDRRPLSQPSEPAAL